MYFDMFGVVWLLIVLGWFDQIQQYGQVQLLMLLGEKGWINSVFVLYMNINVLDICIYSVWVGVQCMCIGQFIDYLYLLMYYQDWFDQNGVGLIMSCVFVL